MAKFRETLALLILLGFSVRFDTYLESTGILPAQPFVFFFAATFPFLAYAAIHALFSARYAWVVWKIRYIVGPLICLSIVFLYGATLPFANRLDRIDTLIRPLVAIHVIIACAILADQIRNEARWRWWSATAFLLVVGSIAVDSIWPGTFGPRLTRAAGFSENPNRAAYVCIFLMVSAMSWNPRRLTRDLSLAMIGAAAVFVTFSRSGVLIILAVLLYYTIAVLKPWRFRRMFKFSIGVLAFAVVAAITFSLLTRHLPIFQSNARRVAMFAGRASQDEFIGPTEKRFGLAIQAGALFSEYPLTGRGTGYSFTMSPGPHNMLFHLGIDNGLLGILGWLFFLVGILVASRGNSQATALALVYCVIGVFSHNALGYREMLILMTVSIVRPARALQSRVLPQLEGTRSSRFRLDHSQETIESHSTAGWRP